MIEVKKKTWRKTYRFIVEKKRNGKFELNSF